MEVLVLSIGGRDSLAEHVGEWNTIVNDEYLRRTLKHVTSVWCLVGYIFRVAPGMGRLVENVK